jgi:hypothetical protein
MHIGYAASEKITRALDTDKSPGAVADADPRPCDVGPLATAFGFYGEGARAGA